MFERKWEKLSTGALYVSLYGFVENLKLKLLEQQGKELALEIYAETKYFTPIVKVCVNGAPINSRYAPGEKITNPIYAFPSNEFW